MRHEVIQTKLHPLDCQCSLHRQHANRWAAVMEQGDIDAMRKGLVLGAWLGGIAAAHQYVPTVIDWLSS